MAYTLTRETEMTVAGMGLVLCVAAALEIEEEEKKGEKKREKKKWKIGWTGPQQDFVIRTGGRKYCQLQELPQNGPGYI